MQPPPPHPRTINEHDIDTIISCLHDLHGGSQPNNIEENNNVDDAISAPEDHIDDQPLLAHVTKRKPLPPGNIKRLLSPAANSKGCPDRSPEHQTETKTPHEINLNGVTYHKANVVTIYNYSAHSTAKKGALVNWGANGGIAGEDVRIIAKTGRQVDIQGIDNHRINNIPIVTAGGIVTTQKGDVVAIMHQYA